LNDQADEGNDGAPARRVESDRRLGGRQVVVEAARVDRKELQKESESTASECLEGHWEKGIRETDRGREVEMMRNEGKDHRMDANMYSIDCRTGDESGGSSGLERGRSHKAEGLIGSKNGPVSLISECFQTIENRGESRDIEKKERSIGPSFQAPIERRPNKGKNRREDGRPSYGGEKCQEVFHDQIGRH
jgi:hypothetical protein